MWKVMKRICPTKQPSLPSAKLNHLKKVISAPGELKILLLKEYKERERASFPARFNSHTNRRSLILNKKLQRAVNNKTSSWLSGDLFRVLSKLKNNITRDHEGYLNEIFKPDVIGEDLQQSLLMLCNKLKSEQIIPLFMLLVNVTTIPKPGTQMLLSNERGIIQGSVLRNVLMRLIYNQQYPNIDRNMSDSNIGGRKGKSCRYHTFIINGIIHEVLSSVKRKPIILQIYDYKQMFDAMNLKEAICDLYDIGVQDETLGLLYEANQEIHMAVNTPYGISERTIIHSSVLQGDTFSPSFASVQVDTIGKAAIEAGHCYKYKDTVSVGPLGMIDDFIGITEAGFNAHELNAFVNVKSAEKHLQFGISKCKTILVGKRNEDFYSNPLKVDKWEVTYKEGGDTNIL